jgi:ribosomal protein S18 acetylase RimI-like enzyme
MIVKTEKKDLHLIAFCHHQSFPKSLSSQLGKKYLIKMFEWFLLSENKFLFHLVINETVVGYCGGFKQRNEPYGSSSGMTQHAFKRGVLALLIRPWLFFHPKILMNFKFLWRNILYRFNVSKKKIPKELKVINKKKNNTTGLVVIGIIPSFQGKGYGSLLINEFEKCAKLQGSDKVNLVVEINNVKAIRSYELNGWVNGKIKNL